MTKANNILLSVENFAEIDEQYDMILERINRFVDNAVQGDVPKQTMSLFFKELEDYIALVDQEITKTKKEVEKTKKLNDKTISGVLTLNISKLTIMRSNFSSILQRFSKGKDFDEEIIYRHNYNSLEEIKETERMVHEMENLIAEQGERNSQGLVLELADKHEDEIELQDTFLVQEYHFLLSINNMQAKIYEAKYYINELTVGPLRTLRKFFQKDFPQSNYQLESVDIEQTTFKKDYGQRIKAYKSVAKKLEYCQSIIETVEELQSYDFSFVATVTTAVQLALKEKTLTLVVKKLKQIEEEQKINYLIDVARLLAYSPFSSLNQKVEEDPYHTIQLTRLYDAYELYQTLGELAHFDLASQGLGSLRTALNTELGNYRETIQQTIQELASIVDSDKKLPTNYKILTQQRKELDELVALYQQVLEKHNSFYALYDDIAINRPKYAAAFEKKKVEQLIYQDYTSWMAELGEVIEPDHFLQEGNLLFSLSAYFDYISQFYTKAKKFNKKNKQLLSQVVALKKSHKGITNYKYTPWETLSKAQKKIISLEDRTERSPVYHALTRLLEKKYNKAYRSYRASRTSGLGSGSRSNSGGRSTGGGGGGRSGGGRSSGGGGSFGGSRGSSGGTSW